MDLSLHLSILKFAVLRTIYWPHGIEESQEWLLDATIRHMSGNRSIRTPDQWSNHKRH
jgi:hypothetical protein